MNDICRTCLSSSNLSPLQNYENITDKIEAISAVKISLDVPNYPTVICEECVDKINLFYCFQKVIINSENELKERCATISNKTTEKKISTKRTRSTNCDRLINKKVTKRRLKNNPNPEINLENIKVEPEQDLSIFNRLVNNEEDFIGEPQPMKETDVSLTDLSLKCNSCMLDFTTKSEFLEHRKSIHKTCKNEKTLYCPSCNVSFTSQAELLNHKRKTHTAPGICNICGMVVRADNLKKHVQRHSEEPVNCNICLKVLKNSESLRGHLLIHKDTLYECEECNRTFKLKSEYHRHLKKHTAKTWGEESDPIILCVHGVMDNAGTFDRLIPWLPSSYYYVCIDLPGHGKSSHFPPHLPLHTVNFLLVYKEATRYFKKKFVILGHSYGGQLGFIYAQMYPQCVEKLILLETITLYQIESDYCVDFLVDKIEDYLKINDNLVTKQPPTYSREEALNKVQQGRRYSSIRKEAAEALLERAIEPVGDRFRFTLDQRIKNFINPLRDHRFNMETMKVFSVKCPILIILGNQNVIQLSIMDPIIKFLKKWKNVDVKIIEGNHDVHNDHPERVEAYIVKFLSMNKGKL